MMIDSDPGGQSASPDILQAMRTTPLLGDLADSVLDRLVAISRIVNVPEDVQLCRQGDAADQLFIVLSGYLSAFSIAPNGTFAVVEVIRSGETLGLLSVLARQPRVLGLRAVTASSLLSVDGGELMVLIQQEPSLFNALIRLGVNEFRALVRQVCDLKLRTTAQRLGCYLLSLSAGQQTNTAALRLPFDKRLLAARLGCRQENLSRAFAALRDYGVETHGARVILHDVARLTAYSEPDEAFA